MVPVRSHPVVADDHEERLLVALIEHLEHVAQDRVHLLQLRFHRRIVRPEAMPDVVDTEEMCNNDVPVIALQLGYRWGRHLCLCTRCCTRRLRCAAAATATTHRHCAPSPRVPSRQETRAPIVHGMEVLDIEGRERRGARKVKSGWEEFLPRIVPHKDDAAAGARELRHNIVGVYRWARKVLAHVHESRQATCGEAFQTLCRHRRRRRFELVEQRTLRRAAHRLADDRNVPVKRARLIITRKDKVEAQCVDHDKHHSIVAARRAPAYFRLALHRRNIRRVSKWRQRSRSRVTRAHVRQLEPREEEAA